MKNTLKLFFIVIFLAAAFFSNASYAQSESMTICTVHVPTICPNHGYAWAVHETLGSTITYEWTTSGSSIQIHMAWHTFLPEGASLATYYANTDKVVYNPQYELQCWGEKTETIGYEINLIADVYLQTIFYEDGVIVEDPPLND